MSPGSRADPSDILGRRAVPARTLRLAHLMPRMRKPKLKDLPAGQRWMPILIALASLLTGGGLSWYMVDLEQQSLSAGKRAATVQRLSAVRARLEGELYSTLYLSKSLIAYVATHPELDQEEFAPLAAEVFAQGRIIRNIALARDLSISHMYPMAGNEAAIGLRYRDNPAQWPAVKRAMDSGKTLLAGPLKLVQGGNGLIARTPIYLPRETAGSNPDGSLRVWGLASVVIDFDRFLFASELVLQDDDYQLALRGSDSLGAAGKVFAGNPELFEIDSVRETVRLPHGSWELAAMPEAGWGVSFWQLPVFYIGLVATLMISLLVTLLVLARQQAAQLALSDYLTGLPNRRLFADRLKQASVLADRQDTQVLLVYVDVNHFKAINDEHGHQAGDYVLIEIAERLRACVRRSDTVARIGGDEFVLLIPGEPKAYRIEPVIQKIHTALEPPVYYDGSSIDVSASVGHAAYPGDTRDIDSLMLRADEKMYVAKRGSVTQLRVID